MALAKNRPAVVAILAEVEPRILGKPHAGFSCNRGAIHEGPGVAVEVEPGGNEYPGQETHLSMWTVRVAHHPEDQSVLDGFSVGLSEFIPFDEVKDIFARHFGTNPDFTNPFRLKVSGSNRYRLGYGTAIRIMDNQMQTRFCFDWGRDDQKLAEELEEIGGGNYRSRIGTKDLEFNRIISLMDELTPEIYLGGPEPELPFEPHWLPSYQSALKNAVVSANHIFFQNMGSSYGWQGKIYGSTDIVFMKIAVK